jgi:trypsin
VDCHCCSLLVKLKISSKIFLLIRIRFRYAPAANTTITYATTEIVDRSNNSRTVAVEQVIPHEKYDGNLITNDIGLIKLKAPIDTGLHASHVKLAMPGSYYPTGTPTTVAGWGRIASGQPLSQILQKAELQIYTYADCKAAHDANPYDLPVEPTNICAGVPEMGKAECNGDSGKENSSSVDDPSNCSLDL